MTKRGWLNAALAELDDIEAEVAEESLPEIPAGTKDSARRILLALAKQSIAPTIYPTRDGEIALYFNAPATKYSPTGSTHFDDASIWRYLPVVHFPSRPTGT